MTSIFEPSAMPDKHPADIRRMFDAVAPRYDITNAVLSLGQAPRWRRAMVEAVAPQPGELILDVAAGTGTSSRALGRDQDVRVVACDFSDRMLQTGRHRQPDLPFVAADGVRLPFRSGIFDVSVIAFSLRNFDDPLAGLEEMVRVTKPGGRLVVCEFSHPTWRPFRSAYLDYLARVFPPVARAFSSSPEAYAYLAQSICTWFDQRRLAEMITSAGGQQVSWRNLSGGIVALHRAFV